MLLIPYLLPWFFLWAALAFSFTQCFSQGGLPAQQSSVVFLMILLHCFSPEISRYTRLWSWRHGQSLNILRWVLVSWSWSQNFHAVTGYWVPTLSCLLSCGSGVAFWCFEAVFATIIANSLRLPSLKTVNIHWFRALHPFIKGLKLSSLKLSLWLEVFGPQRFWGLLGLWWLVPWLLLHTVI